MKPVSFASAAEFRDWLARHHAEAKELTVRLFRVGSSRRGLTYPEALDEALCHGWIDGVRRGLDEESYTIRFTPRRPGSIWSRVNIAHVERLIREGRMQPAGLRAFEARTAARTGLYSFENRRPEKLPPDLDAEFRRHAEAYAFFCAQPPGYRRTINFWIVSAKREETRRRRLARIIAQSAKQRRFDFMAPQGGED